jgi:hypothetical protein
VIREQLKDLELSLPVNLQRPMLQIFGKRHNPYTKWNQQTGSIFIHVPRTAGTSVAQALGAPMPHYPVSRYAAFDPDAFRLFFKFGFVRNPWDRLLSSFAYLRAAAEKARPFPDTLWARRHLSQFADFEEFVLSLRQPASRRRIMRYIHFRPQLSWLAMPRSSKSELEFIGRFERLAHDFQFVAQHLSLQGTLPTTRESRHGDYREAFTPAMRDVAAELYRADIDAFGYDF